ncbi:MAG: hypothetical protein AB1657_01415 [Candidatus Micrarchaeota archaeon]
MKPWEIRGMNGRLHGLSSRFPARNGKQETRNRKGQVALEFLVYAGVFLLIAVAAYALTYFTQRGEVAFRESQMFREFGYKFQYAAIVAYRGGPGFTYDLYFDKNIDGRPFSLAFVTRGGASTVNTAWNGTSSEFAYLYSIPYASYEAEGSCATESGGAVEVDGEEANGHLLFSNDGVERGRAVITVHCGG